MVWGLDEVAAAVGYVVLYLRSIPTAFVKVFKTDM